MTASLNNALKVKAQRDLVVMISVLKISAQNSRLCHLCASSSGFGDEERNRCPCHDWNPPAVQSIASNFLGRGTVSQIHEIKIKIHKSNPLSFRTVLAVKPIVLRKT